MKLFHPCAILVAGFASFLIVGCAAVPGTIRYSTVEPTLVFPPSPEPPRLILLGYLYGEKNLVRNKSAQDYARRAFEILVGLVRSGDNDRQLLRPQSGWVDSSSGRILIADSGQKAIFVFDEWNGVIDRWDDAGSGKGFFSPIAIIGTGDGEFWVTDSERKEVIRLNNQGIPVGVIDAGFERPTGIAIDRKNKRVFVADSAAHQIFIFDTTGKNIGKFGNKGDAKSEFNAPTYLAFSNGELFVSDTLNARVQIFDQDGHYLRQFGKRGQYIGNIPRPKGVAVDSQQHVYVVESYYDYLLVYDRDGKPLLPIGEMNAMQFDLPAGVWLDSFQRVYVADMLNQRVAVFQYVDSIIDQ